MEFFLTAALFLGFFLSWSQASLDYSLSGGYYSRQSLTKWAPLPLSIKDLVGYSYSF